MDEMGIKDKKNSTLTTEAGDTPLIFNLLGNSRNALIGIFLLIPKAREYRSVIIVIRFLFVKVDAREKLSYSEKIINVFYKVIWDNY